MKMPFDTLITDREPFIFIERSKITVSGGYLVSTSKDGVFNVPVSSVHCLMLGNGTSLSAEAVALCAKHNCYISFVKGGVNAHSIWHAGRYQNPKTLTRQVSMHLNMDTRLKCAKKLMI